MDSFISLPLFFLISLSTATLSGMTGMAGGLLFLSVLAASVPTSFVVPIHGAVQFLSNALRVFLLRRFVQREIIFYFYISAPLGAYIGLQLLKSLQLDKELLIIILIILIYSLVRPEKTPALNIPKKGFLGVGLVCGFIGMFTGSVDPFMSPFCLRDDLNKEQIVATKAALQMYVHFMKIPVFLSLGFQYEKYAFDLLILGIGTILGTQLGVYWLKKISEKTFRFLFKFFLLVAAINIVFKLLPNT